MAVVRIFVSSTWLDLQPERGAIEKLLQRFRETKFVGMEYFGSRDETTRATSLEEVDRSDVYLGIIGGRYGSGITEAEYDRARNRRLNCFIYFKQEATIPEEARDQEPEERELTLPAAKRAVELDARWKGLDDDAEARIRRLREPEAAERKRPPGPGRKSRSGSTRRRR